MVTMTVMVVMATILFAPTVLSEARHSRDPRLGDAAGKYSKEEVHLSGLQNLKEEFGQLSPGELRKLKLMTRGVDLRGTPLGALINGKEIPEFRFRLDEVIHESVWNPASLSKVIEDLAGNYQSGGGTGNYQSGRGERMEDEGSGDIDEGTSQVNKSIITP